MRGKPTPPEKKAAALAGLMAGKTISEVAKETGLSVGIIHRMKSEIPQEMEKVGKEKSATFGEMIGQNFAHHIEALNAYVTHTSTPEYIRGQTASDMAALHGAVAGYAVRLLDIAARVGAARGRNDPDAVS